MPDSVLTVIDDLLLAIDRILTARHADGPRELAERLHDEASTLMALARTLDRIAHELMP